MIHLCIDARMARSSGIGTYIRELVPLLNRPPFRLTLLVQKKTADWDQNIKQIVFSAPIYSLQEQILFPLKIPRCDLFWSPHYNVPIFPIQARKKVAVIHDACHLALPQPLSFLEKFYAKKMMRRALHCADAVVTNSHFSKQELQHYLGNPRKDIQVIACGINSVRFQKVLDLEKRQAVREKYRLPEKFFLFVGNVKPHKNLSALVSALSSEDFLVVVGKNKGAPLQKSRVLELGEVPDNDLPVLYSLANLLVLPSLYEGFGLPPLEAMCCGCPTIVSNAASLPEVCQDASLYVDPPSPENIARAIACLNANEELRKNIIAKGLKRVESFNWEKAADAYRKLFIEISHA